jgi:hypothetical protein
MIELDQLDAMDEAELAATTHPPLQVLMASAEELAAHERVLEEIDRESKGHCMWRLDTAGQA